MNQKPSSVLRKIPPEKGVIVKMIKDPTLEDLGGGLIPCAPTNSGTIMKFGGSIPYDLDSFNAISRVSPTGDSA